MPTDEEALQLSTVTGSSKGASQSSELQNLGKSDKQYLSDSAVPAFISPALGSRADISVWFRSDFLNCSEQAASDNLPG